MQLDQVIEREILLHDEAQVDDRNLRGEAGKVVFDDRVAIAQRRVETVCDARADVADAE